MPSVGHFRASLSADTLNWAGSYGTKHILGIIVGAFVAYQFVACVYRIWFHPLSKFPGPPLLSAIYLPWLYKSYVKGTGPKEAIKLHRKYGRVVRIGPDHLAVEGSIAWPEIYAHRSGGKAEYPKQPDFFPGGPGNIIGAPRDIHRRERRQLGHAFSDAALKEQEPLVTGYIDLLLDRLSERAALGETANIVAWLNFTTFDIIGDLTFADSFHSLESNSYHPWVLNIFKGIRGGALIRFLKWYVPTYLLTLAFRYNGAMKTHFQNRALSEEKARARMSLGAEPKDGRRDFMTYMLKKTRTGGDGMSEKEILATSPLLVLAGSETTATALSGLWFYLWHNPSAYKLLAEEVRSHFATEAEINMRSAASLEYLHACLEEALRVYPPVPEVPPRISPGDVIDGRYVPAGTHISVFQWATFRNPDHFLEPDCFRPERWLSPTHPLYEQRFKYDNKAVFKPFSHGSRDCIGKNLAYAEMRLIAARMIHRFDYELLDGQENWHDQRSFIIWEKGPLNMVLRPRNVN